MSNLAIAIKEPENETNEMPVRDISTKEAKLENELFEQTCTIEKVLDKIEKASLMLDQLEMEYSFFEKPDPMAAIEYIKSLGSSNKTEHGEQSWNWINDYETIYQFIRIAMDYICESKSLLTQVIEA